MSQPYEIEPWANEDYATVRVGGPESAAARRYGEQGFLGTLRRAGDGWQWSPYSDPDVCPMSLDSYPTASAAADALLHHALTTF